MQKSCLLLFCAVVFIGIISGVSSTEQSSDSEQSTVSICIGKTYKAGDHKMSVTVDGKKRSFIMHVPSAYKGDKPVPLVVDYHPIGGSGSNQLSNTKYKALTDPEGVISLYPDGTSKNGMAGWNVGPCCSNDDDVKFTREMIASVEKKVCIDKQRVYATGFSIGGGMAHHVACFMSGIFAAVAPAAMDLNTVNSAQCNPVRPISVISFRGTADPVCHYQGGDSGYGDGLNFLGAQRNFAFWAEKNGCEDSPTKNSDGCDEYSNCRNGTKVVLCTKEGGGHDQGDGNIGWPFLKRFTLRGVVCEDGKYYDVDNDNCVESCGEGLYPDEERTCYRCLDGCKNCTDSVTCNECYGDLNVLDTNGTISCGSCKIGEYYDEEYMKCMPCSVEKCGSAGSQSSSSTKQISLELSSVLTVNVALVVTTIVVTLVALF